MILPAPINLVAQALAADAGGEAHAAVRILIRGRGVNHVGAVNNHVAGFVIGDEPARVETLGELEQMLENAASSSLSPAAISSSVVMTLFPVT